MERVYGFFTNLDTILDTHFSIALSMSDATETLCLLNDYKDRLSTRFIGEDKYDEYERRYKERDKETLEEAHITHVLSLIDELCLKNSRESAILGMDIKNMIYVNTYPYKLNDSELEIIYESIYHSEKFYYGDLELVNLPPSSITPKWIKEKGVDFIFDVDGEPWLEEQGKLEGFKDIALPSVQLFVPMLASVITKDPHKALSTRDPNIKKTPMECITFLLSPLIDIEFVSPKIFTPKFLVPHLEFE